MGQDGLVYLNSLAQWKGTGTFGLSSIKNVLASLDNPQDKFTSIHVGGTNGKGSVCAALCSIFGKEGLKVGLTISPNLVKINERFVVDGLQISDPELNEYANLTKIAAERTLSTLSYFEASIVCAFLYFMNQKVDLAVVEVGLGGRLDATNVLSRPEVSVLVSVQRDHEDILGSWPENIAREKVEIFKSGSNAVVGDLDQISLQIAKSKAANVGCKLIEYNRDYSASGNENDYMVFNSNMGSFETKPSLRGVHQIKNMAVAAAAALSAGASIESCSAGIGEAYWPCRIELLNYAGKELIFDCAHNIDGFESLVAHLAISCNASTSWIFGAINTKDWRGMLNLAKNCANKFYLVEPIAPNPVKASIIASYLSSNGVKNIVCLNHIDDIVKQIQFDENSRIVIAGSMYMVGHVKQLFGFKDRKLW